MRAETSQESQDMKAIAADLTNALNRINSMNPRARALLETEWADIEEARDSIQKIAREVE